MHHYTTPKCRGTATRGWNRYELHILLLHGRKGSYYGEIMIYVNGRRDVRLSKGWGYEPIMINAPRPHSCPTPPLNTPVWPEVKIFSESLHFTLLQPCPVWCVPFPTYPIQASSPLSTPSVVVSSVWSVHVEAGCHCPWWISMIRRVWEHGARQSPLSCGWAIRLRQASPIHRRDSEQEKEVTMKKRNDVQDG